MDNCIYFCKLKTLPNFQDIFWTMATEKVDPTNVYTQYYNICILSTVSNIILYYLKDKLCYLFSFE